MEYKYKTFWDRVGASVVDTLVFVPLYITDILYFDTNETGITLLKDAALMILWTLYVSVGHSYFGCTVGKKFFHLTIYSADETSRLSFFNAFKREALWLIPTLLIIAVYFLTAPASGYFTENQQMNYSLVVSIPGLLWIIVKIITIQRDPKGRGLHDHIAKSIVVRETF